MNPPANVKSRADYIKYRPFAKYRRLSNSRGLAGFSTVNNRNPVDEE